MTVKQVEELQAAVLGMLMNRVEGIFIDLQNALQVESGDISPLDAIKLQHKEEQLAERITDILVQQKGE